MRVVDDPKTIEATEAQLHTILLQQSIPLRDALQWYADFVRVDEATQPLLAQQVSLQQELESNRRGRAYTSDIAARLAKVEANLRFIDCCLKERIIDELQSGGLVGFGVPFPVTGNSVHVMIEPVIWSALDIDWLRGTAGYNGVFFVGIQIARLALLHDHEINEYAAISITENGDGQVMIEALTATDKAEFLATMGAEKRAWREQPMWALPKQAETALPEAPQGKSSAGDGVNADGPLVAEAIERARAVIDKPHERSGPKGFQPEIAKTFAELKEAGVITAVTSKARAAHAVHSALVAQFAVSGGGGRHRAPPPGVTDMPALSTVERAMPKLYAAHFRRD